MFRRRRVKLGSRDGRRIRFLIAYCDRPTLLMRSVKRGAQCRILGFKGFKANEGAPQIQFEWIFPLAARPSSQRWAVAASRRSE
jgi:hypothetical protein